MEKGIKNIHGKKNCKECPFLYKNSEGGLVSYVCNHLKVIKEFENDRFPLRGRSVPISSARQFDHTQTGYDIGGRNRDHIVFTAIPVFCPIIDKKSIAILTC